jgi:chemotaxis protein histidine kinase CheA
MDEDNQEESNNAALNAEVEAVFWQLKREYALTLPDKVAMVADIIDQSRRDSDNQSLLAKMLLEIHRTKGTLGSYGFSEISELIESVEVLVLAEKTSDGHGIARVNWLKIESPLFELISSAQAQAQNARNEADRTSSGSAP